ncbi:MAG TPA: OsmC family peroxiredoxin [Candidatus Limnocylindrales bacterium]|jgi:osmotically inducible protein OsmC
MAATRRADATWSGDLLKGKGTVSAGTSRLFRDLPISWATRTEAPAGQTSPEELLAAAHAACFSMAFSNQLAKNGTPATSLDVSSDVTFDKVGDGWKVTKSALTVRGTVPGIDKAKFRELAEAAKDGCPISGALKGNVELSVEPTLG